jgi:hypothetical protein
MPVLYFLFVYSRLKSLENLAKTFGCLKVSAKADHASLQ